MKVRTQEEIQQIDSSLEIIGEDAWDFFAVSEDDTNYEYFNDVRDTQFNKKFNFSFYNVIVTCAALVFLGMVVFLSLKIIINNKENEEFNRLKNLEAGYTQQVEKKLTGAEVSSGDFIDISMAIQDYFVYCSDIVHNQDKVNAICGGESTLNTAITNYFNNKTSMYDEQDCMYRVLLYLLSTVENVSVTQVVGDEDPDRFICSVKLKWLSGEDLRDWSLVNQVNIAKYATSNGKSRAKALRVLLINMDNRGSFGSSSDFVVMTVRRTPNGYMVEDSLFTEKCKASCETYLTQALAIMGK